MSPQVVRRLRIEPAPALGLVIVLVSSVVVWSRNLGTRANFDEGSYTLALHTLRSGQALGADIYLVQPPLFYRLLQLFGATLGTSFDALRIGMIAVSLIGLVAAFVLGRAMAGDWAGLAAAALYSITPPFPANAPLIESDPPSVAFALVAIALAAHCYGLRRASILSLLVGAALAVSILIKLFAVTAFVPLLALALWRRATWQQLAWTCAGGILTTAIVMLPHLGALNEVWDGMVSVHLEARAIDAPSHLDNARRVLEFLHPRSPGTYLVLAGLVLYALTRSLSLLALWGWTVAAIAFTIAMRPLLDHHLVLLAAALAVPAGIALTDGIARGAFPLRVAAVGTASLIFAAGMTQQFIQASNNNRPEEQRTMWAVDVVREVTAPDDLVVSDIPTVPVLAEREVPGFTVDASWGRVVSGALNKQNLLETVRREGVAAVVVGRMLRVSPGVRSALANEFERRRQFDGVTVYYR